MYRFFFPALLFASLSSSIFSGPSASTAPPTPDISYEALIDSASLYGETQRWDDAIRFWREALRRNPSSPLNSKIFTNLGVCLFSAGDYQGADEAFDIALVRDSLSVRNLSYKALTNLYLRNDSIALQTAEKALAIDTTAQMALRVRAGLLLNQGRFPEAIHDYSLILRFDPDDAGALSAIGEAMIASGSPVDAIPYLRRSVAAEESIDSRILLIEALLSADRLGEAVDVANESIRRYPAKGDFYLLRGVANQKFHLNSLVDQDRELAKKYGVDSQTIEKFLPILTK